MILKSNDTLTRAVKGFESAIKWMYDKDTSTNLPLFFELTKKYDNARSEKLVDVFPELKELFDNYEKN